MPSGPSFLIVSLNSCKFFAVHIDAGATLGLAKRRMCKIRKKKTQELKNGQDNWTAEERQITRLVVKIIGKDYYDRTCPFERILRKLKLIPVQVLLFNNTIIGTVF